MRSQLILASKFPVSGRESLNRHIADTAKSSGAVTGPQKTKPNKRLGLASAISEIEYR
jgi:hypothetical protein